MWKKLACLNLALLLFLGVLPVGTVRASAGEADENTGYAVFYKNEKSDVPEEPVRKSISDFSSNGNLRLYDNMPEFSAANRVVTSFNSKVDGSGTEYPLNSKLFASWTTESAAPGQLYAQWTEAADPYLLYINTAEAEQSGDSWALDGGLSTPTALRGEDTFQAGDGTHVIGWSETGRYYSNIRLPGETYELTSSKKLYAVMGINYVTYHYQKKTWGSSGNESVVKTEYYYDRDTEPHERNYEEDLDDRIFLGWNSQEDGQGQWMTVEPVEERPHDLYAQYREYPQGDYCILDSSIGLGNGQEKDFLLLTEGKATLPSQLRDGKQAAYWYGSNGSGGTLYYPCGEEVSLRSGCVLRPAVIYKDSYYALIDGAGGATPAGSAYSAGSCYVTSAGDLSLYFFSDMDLFLKDGQAVTGYKGGKTGNVYSLGDDAWAAMGKEAEDQIARFTAEYQTVSGDHLQYIGNGGKTTDGESSFVQDGLDLSQPGSARYAENPFTLSPEGKAFIGWNTRADGRGDWHDPKEAVDISSPRILYAQWGQNRVTYHYYDRYEGWNAEVKLDQETIDYSHSMESARADRLLEEKAGEYDLFQYTDAGFQADLGKNLTRLQAAELIAALADLPVDSNAAVDLPFTDCDGLSPEEKAVIWAVVDARLMSGSEQNLFHPNWTMKRCEMTSYIYYALQASKKDMTTESMPGFSDVTNEAWYYSFVTSLHNLGILNTGSNVFQPNGLAEARAAVRWAIGACEWLKDGAVANQALMDESCGNLFFEGWSTAPDQTGDWYCSGEPIPAGARIQLYESWIVPPSQGNYYILSGKKLDNERMAKVVSMTEASETVTLPEYGLGWRVRGSELEGTGFFDKQNALYLPNTSLEVATGTVFLEFQPWLSVEYFQNCDGYEDSRVQYAMASSASLQLYTAKDVFQSVPDGKKFTAWNTEKSGKGDRYSPGWVMGEWGPSRSLQLYAQWKDDTPAPPDPGPSPGPAPGPEPEPEPEPEPVPGEPVVTTETGPDGTVTTTTTWADGKTAVALKTPEGDKTIAVDTPLGERMADIELPSKPGPAKAFDDVKAGDWYKDTVDQVTGLGLFSGTSASSFSPGAPLTRGMLVTILHRLSGEVSYGGGSSAFPDVKAEAWYAKAVDWASATGVTAGSGEGFDPEGRITREQLVTMLYRYAGMIGEDSGKTAGLTGFPDASTVSSYAQAAMKWAVAEGLVQGSDGGRIAPKSNATRAEVATVLSRFVGYLSR